MTSLNINFLESCSYIQHYYIFLSPLEVGKENHYHSCDIVIYILRNMYLVFWPVPGAELLENPWNFWRGQSDQGVFVMLMR